jgi:hypothetical protein
MVCEECGTQVVEGPEGGYVCGQCLHTVLPPRYEERRREGLARVAAERQERAAARERAKQAKAHASS